MTIAGRTVFAVVSVLFLGEVGVLVRTFESHRLVLASCTTVLLTATAFFLMRLACGVISDKFRSDITDSCNSRD